jgi:hypothetical protein
VSCFLPLFLLVFLLFFRFFLLFLPCFLNKKRPFFVNLHFSSHEDAWIAFQEVQEVAKRIRFINPTWIRTQYFWKMTNKSRLLLINQIGNYELLKKVQRDSPVIQMYKDDEKEDREDKEEEAEAEAKKKLSSVSSLTGTVEDFKDETLSDSGIDDNDDQEGLLSKRRLITELDLKELDEQQQRQSSQSRTFQTK